MTKKCFICGEDKELSFFYKHSKMADGYLGKCKECTKKYTHDREKKLRENTEWCELERIRSKEKYYRLGYNEKQKQWNKKRPWVKNSQYMNLHRDLKTRKIINDNETAHHWNYELLRDVFILDKMFHKYIHTLLKPCGFYFKVKSDGYLLDTFEKHNEFIKTALLQFKDSIEIKHYKF